MKIAHSIPSTSKYFESMNGWVEYLTDKMNEYNFNTQRQLDYLVDEHVSSFNKTIGGFRIVSEK